MDVDLALEACAQVAGVFEDLGVDYLIGGSVASSLYGIPRSTQDIDLVADLRIAHIEPWIQALEESFYIAPDRVRTEVQRRGSFNIIFLKTMFKVDIFLLKDEPLAQEEMRRRQRFVIDEATALAFDVASPEDTVLQKLAWYQMGRGVSDRQWSDLQGVFKVCRNLDQEYLWKWAGSLGIEDLLKKALRDAGVLPSAE